MCASQLATLLHALQLAAFVCPSQLLTLFDVLPTRLVLLACFVLSAVTNQAVQSHADTPLHVSF